MLISDAEASLDAFFQDSSRKVLLLKGPWGAGKSYFTRAYLESSGSKSPSYQHYVSLFGLSSLNEVKEMINACLEVRFKNTATKTVQKHAKGIAAAAKEVKKAVHEGAPKSVAAAADLLSAAGTSLFWWHVKAQNSVIVFDDLERSTLKLDAILGLASSLAENSKAKILIICNEDELGNERLKQLNIYREKLVDTEILFKPDIANIVEHYLSNKELVPGIVDLFHRINSNNIRLLFKINSHWKILSNAIRDEKVSLDTEDLIHAAKIVCLRYLAKQPIRSNSIHDIIFAGIFSSGKKDGTQEEKEFSELSGKLSLFPGTIYDDLSLEILQAGYVTQPSLDAFRKKLKENSDREEYDHDIRKAYAGYGNSFSASTQDVIRDVKRFLDKYADKVQTSEINQPISFLRKIGYKGSLNYWIEKHLTFLDRAPDPFERVKAAKALPSSMLTKRFITKTLKGIPSLADPLELIKKINKSHSYGEREAQALNGLRPHQVFQLVAGNNPNTIEQMSEIYKSWNGTNGAAGEFAQKIDSALSTLKKRSKLNAARVDNLFRAR